MFDAALDERDRRRDVNKYFHPHAGNYFNEWEVTFKSSSQNY